MRSGRAIPRDYAFVPETLNQYRRGWAGYFHYRNSSKALGRLKWHVEERLRTPSPQAARAEKPRGRV